VTVINGYGSFVSNQCVSIDGERKVSADHILVAVGGKPSLPQIEGIHHCISSDGFFALDKQPEVSTV
jgi:glutathione reductase (NADPH)